MYDAMFVIKFPIVIVETMYNRTL